MEDKQNRGGLQIYLHLKNYHVITMTIVDNIFLEINYVQSVSINFIYLFTV